MLKTPLFGWFVLDSIAVAALHWFATSAGLYWQISWIDFVTHTLGGLWVALFSFLLFFGNKTELKLSFILKTTLFSVLVVGLAWEIFEYLGGAIIILDKADEVRFIWDTIYDFCADFLGAFLAFMLIRGYTKRNK